MKPIYSRRALADLHRISDYYAVQASPAIAEAIGQRLAEVVDQFCQAPRSAPILPRRSKIRSVPVVNYPFRIFYRIRKDAVEIVHIRHTSRQPLKP
ncbi:type II toxin-antitoxin system RelE/ParE family toxin [Tardiphaga alba]|uniref:Type II toxin-antitoxin system RelE/ParE family toxin n=1 Tax=Tardiphaga alba TaxID=340268 RepID=A0ABX8ADP6_9BRAD|nr:type II toxin-antitoxin system RelE/ParE family toxin [Tardiphaga alba]QUS41407.1 type II toxin-antitoxin system RelE/ParE family toxin [Tardiphaga alba]